MIEGTYQWQANKVPVTGKDHLVLADYRLSVSQRNSSRIVTDDGAADGESFCGMVAFENVRSDGTTQNVTHESGAVTPFPNTKDDLVLVAMISLSHLAGHPERLWFHLPHVISLLRWSQDSFYRKKVARALARLKAMDSRFEGVWYDRKDKSTRSYDSGLIAEFSIASRPGRLPADARPSYLQWTPAFRQSLLNGNLLNVSFEQLTRFSSHAGTQLFRHLNKVWHGGNKLHHYERDLEDLAYGQLQLGTSKWMKRNFSKMLAEHVEHGTLLPCEETERFRLIDGR